MDETTINKELFRFEDDKGTFVIVESESDSGQTSKMLSLERKDALGRPFLAQPEIDTSHFDYLLDQIVALAEDLAIAKAALEIEPPGEELKVTPLDLGDMEAKPKEPKEDFPPV